MYPHPEPCAALVEHSLVLSERYLGVHLVFGIRHNRAQVVVIEKLQDQPPLRRLWRKDQCPSLADPADLNVEVVISDGPLDVVHSYARKIWPTGDALQLTKHLKLTSRSRAELIGVGDWNA